MYPDSWHKLYGDQTGHSARRILPRIVKTFEVASTVEVGCGNAHWTQAAIDEGVKDYRTVDGPWADIDALLVSPFTFQTADLAKPLELPRRYDLAICLEVGEHLPRNAAGTLVDSLIAASDVVLFGAAVRYQGGFQHLNEQRQSYWRDKFSERGYEAFDLVRPQVWNDRTVHYWYRQNAFVYVRATNQPAMRKAAEAERAMADPKIFFDAIHPEKYEMMASYESLALKRLMLRLPASLARRVGRKLRGALRQQA